MTLLPKVGKNLNDIKNWRPITLTNCDLKLITKVLANRMSVQLESMVDVSQTAYVPGRSVMDNLRSNMFIKNYCESNKVDGLLVSLDAKKAFDSVDHNYICRVLKEYGVGDRFIKFFKVLYKDLTVRVLVNGHFSEKINIERGVKQGDALSCSLFILCIDPLIRNINANENIEGINLTSKITRNATTIKCSGYADDIAIVCKNSLRNVQEIFREYERLTRLSGLELNADKTEILRIGVNKNSILTISVKYCGIQYQIKSITSIKICGIYFCSDIAIEYDYNILEKIE
jgi:hypothetical protein